MKQLIEDIKAGLQRAGANGIEEALLTDSQYVWEGHFPIAVVHTKSRIKEDEVATFFDDAGLMDNQGFTSDIYTREQLSKIAKNAPQYLQRARLLALKTPTKFPVKYSEKFPNDYWKKLQDVDHINAVVEIASFTKEDTECSVEFVLREVMRKRKEVNALKKLGFVWVAAMPRGIMIESVLKHYFLENTTVLEDGDFTYFIGWNETLKGVNMRYFVCPPSA